MQWDQLDPSPLDRAFDTGYSSGRVWELLSAHGAAGSTQAPQAQWEDVQQGGGLAALTNAVLGRSVSPAGTTVAAVVACLVFLVAVGGAVALTVVCLYEGRCGAYALPSATPVADTLFVVFSMWVLLMVVPLVATALALHRHGPMAWAILLTGLASAATFITGIVALADTAESNVARIADEQWPAMSAVQQAHFASSKGRFRDSLREGSAVYGSMGFVFGVLLGLVALGCAYLFFAWGGWWEDKIWCCCPVGGGRLAGGDMDAARGVGVFRGAQHRRFQQPAGTGANSAQTPAAADSSTGADKGGDPETGTAGAKRNTDSGASDSRRMGMPRVVSGDEGAGAAEPSGGGGSEGGAPERKPGGRAAASVGRSSRGRHSSQARGGGAGDGEGAVHGGGSTPRGMGGWRRQASTASGDSGEDSPPLNNDGTTERPSDTLLSSPGRSTVSRSRIQEA